MAIIEGEVKWTGRVGDVVYRDLGGKWVAQSRPSHYHDRKSLKQLHQRSGMNNILANYRLLKEGIRGCFEKDNPDKRDYDYFLHYNMLQPFVVLPKEDYTQGRAILAPYVVSHGSLKPLELQLVDGRLQFMMDSSDWMAGDLCKLISLTSDEPAFDQPSVLRASFTNTYVNEPRDEIIMSEPLTHGAYAFIHVRNTHKGSFASPQQLILV